jgi:hypothetical protein
VSRTESCVTDCHDSGRNCEGRDGVRGEGASCVEFECDFEFERPGGGVVGNFLSRGRDDWPAVDKDKGGDSGRDWARELPPRSLLLVSIVESTDGCGYITEWVPIPLVWQSTETQVHMATKVNLPATVPVQIRHPTPLAPSPR